MDLEPDGRSSRQIGTASAVRGALHVGPRERVLGLVLLGTLCWACEFGSSERGAAGSPAADVATERVSLTVNPSIARGRLTVDGTTDLPDGAVIMYEVRHERWRTGGELRWFLSGQVGVENGEFTDRVRVSAWPDGPVDVWVAFQTVLPDGEQPPAILERFGDLGERLAGDNVVEVGGMKRVEATAALVK